MTPPTPPPVSDAELESILAESDRLLASIDAALARIDARREQCHEF